MLRTYAIASERATGLFGDAVRPANSWATKQHGCVGSLESRPEGLGSHQR